MITTEALPVLEPLSRATRTLLEPITLFTPDYLRISLSDDANHFIVQAEAYVDPGDYYASREATPVTINGELKILARMSASGHARHTWVKRVPERKELGDGKWKLGCTDFTALVIHHNWKPEKLIFSADAKIIYDYLISRFLRQSKAGRIIADFKVHRKVPEMPRDWHDVEDPDLALADYQKVALMASLAEEGYALFMQQGTGKTPIAVHRICLEGHRKRRRTGKMYRALVLCPKQCRANWKREFERFHTYPGKVAVMRGHMLRRTRILLGNIRKDEECDWSATIISIDSVDKSWRALGKVPWDIVILDESHYIKNPSSKRSKAALKFQETAKRRMPLTGTPIANSLMDIYPQLEFLSKGMSGFTNFTNFKSFHGKFKKVMSGATPIQKLVGIKGLPLIQERLARCSFICTKKEAGLQLPDKCYDLWEVEMTPLQAEIYETLQTKLVAEIEDGLASGTITADHVLTMLLRLAQVTSNHIKLDDHDEPQQIAGENVKVTAVLDMLAESDAESKTVVWAYFVEDIRVISQALHAAGIKHVGYHANVHPDHKVRDAEAAEIKMNMDPDCKVFLGNPSSAGTGLNIFGYDRDNPDAYQTNVDHAIYVSCNWSMLDRSQSEDRVHRRGTRMPVRITDLVVPGSIDEEIRARVLSKAKKALMITDVREILKKMVAA